MKTKTLKKNKINIITLGCSKNTVDSEVMMSQLVANNMNVTHESTKDDSNIIIINTCGFIDNAKQESIDMILQYSEAKARGDVEKLYVTGCLSHRYKDELATEIPEVDAWFGTMELPRLLKTLKADYKKELLGERLITTPSHTAFLKISEGCNRPCAFCAIPLMRGKHISKPIETVLFEANHLVQKGVKELVLIAQDLTYYGLDIYEKRDLANLLTSLSEVDGLEWIRLQYAYPSQFPMEVLSIIRDTPKICSYLDMPLQHASDSMLKAMRRGITANRTQDLIDEIRATVPGIHLRTTMLSGFPGETDKDHQELISFIERNKFERLGVFPYSHEESTAAFNLVDDVPDEVKQERAEDIMAIQQGISLENNLTKVGSTMQVLFDRVEGDYSIGRTEFDSPDVDNEVLVLTGKAPIEKGAMKFIKITNAEEFDLYGEMI